MIPRSRYGCIYDVHSRGRPMFVNSTDEKISALGNQNNPVNCLFIIYLPKFLRSFKLLLNLVTVEVLNHFRWDDPVQHCNYSRLVRLHSTTTHIIILHKSIKLTKFAPEIYKIYNRPETYKTYQNIQQKHTKCTPETYKCTPQAYKTHTRNLQIYIRKIQNIQ